MAWLHITLPFTIVLESSLHVGSGYGIGPIQKAAVKFPERHRQGVTYRPYIPGSALKGRTREACEVLARQVGLPVCGIPRVGEAEDGSSHDPDRCLVCRIFGAIGGNSPDAKGLRWQNAYPTGGSDTSALEMLDRAHVQLSRARGVAAGGRLFAAELAASGLAFEGGVSGWLMGTECPSHAGSTYEVALLLAGLRLVDTLGGMRRRGPGRCTLVLHEPVRVRPEGGPEVSRSLTELLAPAEDLESLLTRGTAADGA